MQLQSGRRERGDALVAIAGADLGDVEQVWEPLDEASHCVASELVEVGEVPVERCDGHVRALGDLFRSGMAAVLQHQIDEGIDSPDAAFRR